MTLSLTEKFDRAAKGITQQRGQTYGHPADDFHRVSLIKEAVRSKFNGVGWARARRWGARFDCSGHTVMSAVRFRGVYAADRPPVEQPNRPTPLVPGDYVIDGE